MKLFASLTNAHILAWIGVALYTLSIAAHVDANEPQEPAYAEVLEQLNLTESQYEQIIPVLEQSVEQRDAVLTKHGIDLDGQGDRPGFRTLRKMSQDMQKLRAETEQQLSGILDEPQMATFREWQDSNRAAMRERLMGR